MKENVDGGVYVKDLTTFVVKSAMEIDHVMQASSLPRERGTIQTAAPGDAADQLKGNRLM